MHRYLLLFLLVAAPVHAEQTAWLPGRPIGREPGPAVRLLASRQVDVALDREARHSKSFVALASVRMGTALFDTWTTRRALKRHEGAHEGNPVLRPLAKNPAALYGVLGGIAAVQVWLADRRMHAGGASNWVLALSSTANAVSGGFNLRF